MDSGTIQPARTLAASNSRFDVFLDHVEEPGGFTVPDYLVVSPKRRLADGTTGIAVLPVVEGKFALLKLYRHAVAAMTWEIPRGFIEEGDDAARAAVRELQEETGLECNPDALVALGSVVPDAGIVAARIRLFAARECRRVRAFSRNELGLRSLELVTPDAMRAMILQSEIEDPSTIVCYHRYCALQAGEAPRGA